MKRHKKMKDTAGKENQLEEREASAKHQRQGHLREMEKFENPSGMLAALMLEFSPIFRVGLGLPYGY